jgi:hypothetical protein
MADLKILEAMQQESVRKLASAQELKNRRQEALTHTESRLEDLKYRNGQLHASKATFVGETHSGVSGASLLATTVHAYYRGQFWATAVQRLHDANT